MNRNRRSTRRAALALSLAAAAAAAAPAWAQQAASPGIVPVVGLFSLLGDQVEYSATGAPTDSRMDPAGRRSHAVKGIGFDRAVAREVQAWLKQNKPVVALRLFGASASLGTVEQRRLADGAASGALPGWMIDAIEANRVTHALIVTRDRIEARAPDAANRLVGHAAIDGIGIHLDDSYTVYTMGTNVTQRGALVPHAVIRLSLLDVNTGKLAASTRVNEQIIVAPRDERRGSDASELLTPEEKIRAMHRMLETALQRGLPEVLKAL